VTIMPVPTNGPPPTTQDLINGQVKGSYDITAGDYVTYIDDEVHGMAKLRIIAEASFLQPNVLTLLVKANSSTSTRARAGLRCREVPGYRALNRGPHLAAFLLAWRRRSAAAAGSERHAPVQAAPGARPEF
jgi:hypothetical protein